MSAWLGPQEPGPGDQVPAFDLPTHDGGRNPGPGPQPAMVRPLMRATGHLPSVVRFAGPQVLRDVWIAAQPLAVLARLSRLFLWLPEERCGSAAAALTAFAVALAAVMLLT